VQKIAEESALHRERIEYLAKWVASARLSDMSDAEVLCAWLEEGLSPLTDEVQVRGSIRG
jgi:hypothetical protein